ncbi:MAG TPA: aldehyde dehydrogenase [Myxococcaceae bacterium]|jgi:aldehyde dehydrogenase (NAD(P)+)
MSAIPLPTAPSELDQVVHRLKEGSRTFAGLPLDRRIDLCEQMRRGYAAIAGESAVAACHAKGIDPESPVAGEEWISGPMVTLRILRQTVEALKEIKRHGVPRLERSKCRALPDGRLAVQVFPSSNMDRALLAKHVGEVYLQAGVTADNLHEHQASFYKKPHGGKLCLVLGGGNINAIPPTDVLYKMFVEGTVCLLKMNPVNAYLGPFLERAFRPAIDQGFLAVAYGGAGEGAYLVNHPLVDEVHITGSDRTHDLMVWGPPGPEREARRQRNDPLLKKEISSELGNVSPVIVVPGPWEEGELGFQAANIAGMVAHNASFNCNATKLLVTPKGWSRRAELLDRVEKNLAKADVRKAYYPGAEQRWAQFTEGRAGLRLIGKPGPGQLAWAIIPDVDPSKQDDRVFTTEPFCGVLSETALEGSDPAAFLEKAVPFVNDHVWGTLCATLVVHPETMRDPRGAAAVEKAIGALRYGSVCVNTWPGAVFGLGQTPWGAYPGSTLQDIQSGRGWVHNTFMLEGIEKAVLRAPVKTMPVQPWFPGHRGLGTLGKKLVDLEADPSWLKVPAVAAAALRA